MAKARGLGRGLEALLGASDVGQNDLLSKIDVQAIQPGRFQTRRQIDNEGLQELADSIRAQGVIQPIVVREIGSGRYEIIAGERRWRASQLADLDQVPAVVKNITDEEALAIGLIENIQRQNLNPIEEAQGLKRLIDEFDLTHEKVANAIGRSRSSISNSLRLLALPDPVQKLLYEQQLSMGHARALLPLPVLEQISLGTKAAQMGWSVREVERRCHELLNPAQKLEKIPYVNQDIAALEERLSQHLGAKSEIQTKNGKKGKLTLHFNSLEEFDYLLNRLGLNG